MKQLHISQSELLSISLRDEERKHLREALISHMKKTPAREAVFAEQRSHDRIRFIIFGISLVLTATVLVVFAR